MLDLLKRTSLQQWCCNRYVRVFPYDRRNRLTSFLAIRWEPVGTSLNLRVAIPFRGSNGQVAQERAFCELE